MLTSCYTLSEACIAACAVSAKRFISFKLFSDVLHCVLKNLLEGLIYLNDKSFLNLTGNMAN